MTEDYVAAATRHFRDGALLEDNRRVANADQLFGFAAECAIKSALVSLPGCAGSGVLAQKYREHVDRLWDLAPLQDIQRRHRGLVVVLRGLQRPFGDWSTDQRYAREGAVSGEALSRHRQAAARVLGSVGVGGTRGEA